MDSLAAVDLLRQRVDAVADRTDRLAKDVLPRLAAVEDQTFRLVGRADGLSEHMRQRFRVVNERLGEIDRRLAA